MPSQPDLFSLMPAEPPQTRHTGEDAPQRENAAVASNAPANAAETPRRRVLIDGSNLFFRGQWSRITSSWRGRDTTCLGAYLRALSVLMRDLERDCPADFIVCWDGGHAARTALSEAAVRAGLVPKAYKQERREARAAEETGTAWADFKWQLDLAREATAATRAESVLLPGEEADDLVASYAARFRKAGGADIILVTTDRDYFQLLWPGTRMYNSGTKTFYAFDDFRRDYGLDSPARWIDAGALAGETGPSSDSIYGVPGVGYKTAAKIVAKYGDLETILARCAAAPANAKEEKVAECAEIVRLAKKLKAMRDFLPVPEPAFRGDWRLLSDFLDNHGLRLPRSSYMALLVAGAS